MYVCIYIYIYIYTHTYIHIYTYLTSWATGQNRCTSGSPSAWPERGSDPSGPSPVTSAYGHSRTEDVRTYKITESRFRDKKSKSYQRFIHDCGRTSKDHLLI